MRNGSHRLWLCIAAAAAGSLIAVPAASGGGFPDVARGGADVVKHHTAVTIFKDSGSFHGRVNSEVRRCEDGRLVSVFKQRRGADRKLGTVRSTGGAGTHNPTHNWWIVARWAFLIEDGRVYAKAKREVLNGGDVCRADRSKTFNVANPYNGSLSGVS